MAQEIADSKLIDTWSSSGLIVKPDISKIIEGWQLGEQPPHEYMNWLQNTFGSKLNHILKNGVANWSNETEYLAGSSVQHNGNIWLCKTTNTNSEPTDANANWKRIITVESLTTILNGYVALTQFTGTNQVFDVNGYQKFPGGVILQWGQTVPASSSQDYIGAFPISFPNGVFSIYIASGYTAETGQIGYAGITFDTLSAYRWRANVANSLGFSWFAIGY